MRIDCPRPDVCQLQRTPSPLAGKGKRPQVGQALSGRPRVASESFVTHLTCEHEHSIGQARAIGKPYFISRKVFSTRSSTSRRLNASPSRNLAHVRMICNVTRARSNLRHGLAGGLLIRGDGLPCAIPAEKRAAQRASTPGISSPACQARPSRRGLRIRME